MRTFRHTTALIPVWLLAAALSAQDRNTSSSARMPDGKQWTTHNLDVDIAPSYCYEDADANCREYGRLYTWDSAQRACQSLGQGWRLPAQEEWRQLAKHYGGVYNDSGDGKSAFKALLTGGNSGFNAVLSGGRSQQGEYARLKAHGFYWTASESNAALAWFINFGQGSRTLYLQSDGEKLRAFSVRCVRD